MQQIVQTHSEVATQSHDSSMDLFDEVDLIDSQPQQMNYILQELQSQRTQLQLHTTQFEELNKLREELTIAHDRIIELEKVNRQLKQQLKDQQSQDQKSLNEDFLPLQGTTTQPTQNTTTSRWAHPLPTQQQKPSISPAQKQRRIEAAARLFQRPSAIYGFQYLYFFSKARMPIGLHNDFTTSILESLNKVGINPIDFEPLDPKYVYDPKYQEDSQEIRANIAHELQCERAKRAINYIHAPIKYAVARDFQDKGWLSIEDLKAILATKWKHPDEHDDLIQNFKPTDDDDSLMEYELTRTNRLRKQAINTVISSTPTTDILFLTETWLLSPNKYYTHWTQHHTYGIRSTTQTSRGRLGLSILILMLVLET
ncbi:hypothetical protein INT45_004993 [Circinella minor]|uniref:L27 domain-containing protein n=1 Tax=Circinella minor TaxID=1195481 RepID=A0A8H7VJR1_9FUNG|nr:hypothetical protein INT45_004993 [Circinella minor]